MRWSRHPRRQVPALSACCLGCQAQAGKYHRVNSKHWASPSEASPSARQRTSWPQAGLSPVHVELMLALVMGPLLQRTLTLECGR